jgi:hypothetical protein
MTDEFEFDDLSTDEDPFVGVESGKKGDKSDKSAPTRSIEEFEAEVDRNIKVLMARKKVDAKRRREAALWLGDSGSPRAIPPLKLVYEKDRKNKSVHDAAAYALGQFKALDEAINRDEYESVEDALERPENAHIMKLLTDIALYDKRGGRQVISTSLLVRLMLVLMLTLVVLGIFNVLLLNRDDTPEPAQIAAAEDTTPGNIVDDIENLLPDLRADAQTVRDLVDPLLGGGAITCNQTWQNPPIYTVPAGRYGEYPVLISLVEGYNTHVASLNEARAPIVEACARASDEQGPSLTAGQRDAASFSANEVLNGLPEVESQINEARTEIETLESQRAATETAEAETQTQTVAEETASAAELATGEALTAAAPPPTATPGLEPDVLRTHVGNLRVIISEATGVRGHNSVLEQYWINVRDTASYTNCRTPRPAIPENYVLPPEHVGQSPQLEAAVEQVNVGLSISRLNWASFEQGCANADLAARVRAGLEATQLARDAYNVAERIITELQGS